jgi:hypothetical protein
VADGLRDGARFPDGWFAPVVTAVQALLDRVDAPAREPDREVLEPVRPGSLGSWSDEEPHG